MKESEKDQLGNMRMEELIDLNRLCMNHRILPRTVRTHEEADRFNLEELRKPKMLRTKWKVGMTYYRIDIGRHEGD